MTERVSPEMPLVESVLHPTDFSVASERAFAHALAVALLRQTRFTILHVTPRPVEQHWSEFPQVRKTLQRWGLLAPNAPRSAVYDQLGMRVEKITAKGRDPVRAILDHLEREPAELIVLATEGRSGTPRWLRASVAESVARESATMTLFVPGEGRGFIDVADGRLTLHNILIPVAAEPAPDAAIQFAARAAALAGDGDVVITLLHVGEALPALALPEVAGCAFRQALRRGDVADAIEAEAREIGADLVVMVTAGHSSMLDALRGSTTEQILRRVECPVLAVPLQWQRAVEARQWVR